MVKSRKGGVKWAQGTGRQRLGESLRLCETQAIRYAGVSGGPPWVTGAATTGSDGCDMLECHGSSGSR